MVQAADDSGLRADSGIAAKVVRMVFFWIHFKVEPAGFYKFPGNVPNAT